MSDFLDALRFIIEINAVQALFLVVGIILVVVEMFHPGFGAPGIIGGIMLFIGVMLIADTVGEKLILIIIILAILGIALTFVLHSATKGKLSKTLILSHSQQKESGYIGTEDLEFFVGKEGFTVTVLRPSGTADFDGVRIAVVSEGSFIPGDTKIRVIKVDGPRIVVKKIDN